MLSFIFDSTLKQYMIHRGKQLIFTLTNHMINSYKEEINVIL